MTDSATHQDFLKMLQRVHHDLPPDVERELNRARIAHLGFERAIHLRDAEALASI